MVTSTIKKKLNHYCNGMLISIIHHHFMSSILEVSTVESVVRSMEWSGCCSSSMEHTTLSTVLTTNIEDIKKVMDYTN